MVKNKVDLSHQADDKSALINDFIDKMLLHDIGFGSSVKKAAMTSNVGVQTDPDNKAVHIIENKLE